MSAGWRRTWHVPTQQKDLLRIHSIIIGVGAMLGKPLRMPLTRFKPNAHEPSAETILPPRNGMTRRRNTKAPMVHDLGSKYE